MIKAHARRIESLLSVEHRSIGTALLRILLGLNVLILYATHIKQWNFIWGDDGVMPLRVLRATLFFQHNFSLYAIGDSQAFHFALFIAGIIVTTLFTIGYQTRLFAILFYIFTWSLYARNQSVLDGGDNLLYLLAFFLIFADSGRRLSLDAAFRSRDKAVSPFVALLHNAAVGAIIAQISILYFTSGWAKMRGHMWVDGTAIYYILRTAEFNLTPWASNIFANAWIGTLLCYSTIVFQIGFPFLIWNRTIKPYVMIAAITFHLSIAYFMGLVWFSWTLIAAEFVILSDYQYEAFFSAALRTLARLRRFASRRAAHEPQSTQ
jgi:Vitamin K-dependent gamma-carboxylase